MSDGDCTRCQHRFSQSDTHCRGCGKLKRNGKNYAFPLRLAVACEVIATHERGRSAAHVVADHGPGATVYVKRGELVFT